jgi:spermidine synthase
VLTPNFGGDIYVSGSIIGVFLAALSLGYSTGGWVADRWPRRELFAFLILAAGLFAAMAPTLKDPLLEVTQAAITDRRWGACAYALLLYGPSTILLGMVSPFAIRLSGRRLAEMGKVSGRLYALSTFGSIFGTLFTSFYWIAWWPVSRITLTTGLILCALGVGLGAAALLAGARERARGSDPVSARCLLPLLLLLAPEACAAERELYQKETLYHRVIVTEDGTWRTLKFNRAGQSGMSLRDSLRSEFRYTDAFHLVPVYQPKLRRVLFIGLGAATGPKQFRAFYPDIAVDTVEIDPEVVEVAKRYFRFNPDAKTKVTVSDGRVFLNSTRETYDAILVDAYYADAIPFHLTTIEFVRLVKRRLAPGGVAFFNMIGGLEDRASKMVRSEWKTVRRVFSHCAVFPVLEEGESPRSYSRERVRNVILIATDGPPLSPSEVARRAARLKNSRLPHLERIAAALLTTELAAADVPLLTDDFAPVNNLVPVP